MQCTHLENNYIVLHHRTSLSRSIPNINKDQEGPWPDWLQGNFSVAAEDPEAATMWLPPTGRALLALVAMPAALTEDLKTLPAIPRSTGLQEACEAHAHGILCSFSGFWQTVESDFGDAFRSSPQCSVLPGIFLLMNTELQISLTTAT